MRGSRAEIVSQHLAAAPAPPSRFLADGDARLDTLVLAALAKDPANRPPSMAALRRELKTLVS
jgi:hypothetical protein